MTTRLQNILASQLTVLVLATIFGVACSQAFAQSDSPRLQYKWQADKEYGYQFTVTARSPSRFTRVKGFASFQLADENVSKKLSGEEFELLESNECSATAFVVNSDGYLLTCAHCVEGAKKVQVTINDEKHEAEVVDIDSDFNLAILKTNAKGLVALPLAGSRKVELAQDVRVAGYPLSELLGESIKVVKGTVSGLLEDEEQPLYQIDVAVNSGNSGGPLVDESGAVAGVVISKLSGERVSRIGFAIPIRFACELLIENGIQFTPAKDSKDLAGPALAKKIVPAVTLLEAEIGAGRRNRFGNFQFTTKGSVELKNGTEYKLFEGKSIVSTLGKIIDYETTNRLPFMFGSASMMPFDVLPESRIRRWSVSEPMIIAMPDGSQSTDPWNRRTKSLDPHEHFRNLQIPGLHRNRQTIPSSKDRNMKTRTALANRTAEYRITDVKDDLVSVSAKYRFSTVDDDREYANLRYETGGVLVFDKKLGLFVSKDLEGKLKLKVGKETAEVPVTLKYEYVELQTRAESAAEKQVDN